jgi:hypothetical protein
LRVRTAREGGLKTVTDIQRRIDMSQKVKVKKIKPAKNYGVMKDPDVQTLGETVSTNLTNNDSLPNPPVDPKTLKSDADNLTAALVAAQDGGKKAVAQEGQTPGIGRQGLASDRALCRGDCEWRHGDLFVEWADADFRRENAAGPPVSKLPQCRSRPADRPNRRSFERPFWQR